MLNTRKIYLDNHADFAREIGISHIPAVQDFEKMFVKPSAAAVEMGDAFNNALGEVQDTAFVVGFNAAVRFLAGCMMEKEGA